MGYYTSINEGLLDRFRHKKFGKHSEDNKSDKKPNEVQSRSSDNSDHISEEELKRRQKWNELAYEKENELLNRHWSKFASIAKKEFAKNEICKKYVKIYTSKDPYDWIAHLDLWDPFPNARQLDFNAPHVTDIFRTFDRVVDALNEYCRKNSLPIKCEWGGDWDDYAVTAEVDRDELMKDVVIESTIFSEVQFI